MTRERERVYMPRTPGLESKTHQSMAAACDINLIIKRSSAGEQIQHLNRNVPRYVDLTNAPDLQGHFEAAERAVEEFMALPADVRAAAGNDPVEFLAMAQDPDGMVELVEAGLGVERTPEPQRVEVVNPPTPEETPPVVTPET